MANRDHLERLLSWNRWRAANPIAKPDLAGADLAGRDLVEFDLSEADLTGATLSRANLRGAILRNADLSRARLDGANLEAANCTGATFEWANCTGASFRRAVLRGANLDRSRCDGAVFNDADLREASVHGADLRFATFTGALLIGVDLTSQELKDVDLAGALFAKPSPPEELESLLKREFSVESAAGGASDDRAAYRPGGMSGSEGPLAEAPSRTAGPCFKVWYGTNRRPLDPGNPSRGYGKERDDQTHCGWCQVLVPPTHRIGSLGSSLITRLLHLRPDDRLKLREIMELEPDRFWEELRSQIGDLAPVERTALVFLHGYNVNFENAARRAAQLGYDLGSCGVTAFFSWPSRAHWRAYLPDGASVQASEGAITEFLVGFAERSGADRVHVIAHSMGNQGLLRAVQRIVTAASARTSKPFGQIILAAPDVDRDVFRSLSAAYAQVAERTTMYVSKSDLALKLSSVIHDYGRVGWVPPVSVVDGIDTVEVTDVDLSVLGHTHMALVRVLYDMHELIRSGRPPEQRMALREQATEEGRRYWAIGS